MRGTRWKSLRNPHKVFGENNYLLKVAVAEVPEGDAIDFVGVAAHDTFHAHKRSRF